MEEKKIPQAPRAFKKPHEVKVHGVTLRDDYFWLRDRGSPEVLDYLKAENAYLEEALKPTEEFQKKLYGEMLSRIKETDLSVPVRRESISTTRGLNRGGSTLFTPENAAVSSLLRKSFLTSMSLRKILNISALVRSV